MVSTLLYMLRKDEHIVISKTLIRSLGLEAAVLYSELIAKRKFFEDKHELIDLYWFHESPEEIEQNTGLTLPQQMKAIDTLKYYDLLKVKGTTEEMYFMVMDDEHTLRNVLEAGKD